MLKKSSFRIILKKQEGLTLIEILVSLAIAMFLLLGLSSFFIKNLQTQSDTIKASTLNQDLRQAVMLISRDIKRAGYSGDSVTNSFNTIRICDSDDENAPCDSIADADAPTQADNTINNLCILYTYDRNKSGGVPNMPEYNGFKLVNDALFYRNFGDNLNNCKADSNNSWVQLTDNNIKINQLKFCYLDASTDTKGKQLNLSNCKLLPSGGERINNIVLYIDAELKSDSSVKSKYIEVIRLYNSPIKAS